MAERSPIDHCSIPRTEAELDEQLRQAIDSVNHAIEVLEATSVSEPSRPEWGLSDFLVWWDVPAACILLWIHRQAWRSTAGRWPVSRNPERECELALSAVGNALTAGMTALSFLISGVIVATFQASEDVSTEMRWQLFRAFTFLWLATMLGVALLTHTPMVAHLGSVAKRDSVGGCLGVFFIFLAIGATNLLIVVFFAVN